MELDYYTVDVLLLFARVQLCIIYLNFVLLVIFLWFVAYTQAQNLTNRQAGLDAEYVFAACKLLHQLGATTPAAHGLVMSLQNHWKNIAAKMASYRRRDFSPKGGSSGSSGSNSNSASASAGASAGGLSSSASSSKNVFGKVASSAASAFMMN
jgi:uncharacterized membrane protein YgcG